MHDTKIKQSDEVERHTLTVLVDNEAGVLARVANWLWCLGILYSTIATRQHVAIDVAAGAVLGAVVAVCHLRLQREKVLRVNQAA